MGFVASSVRELLDAGWELVSELECGWPPYGEELPPGWEFAQTEEGKTVLLIEPVPSHGMPGYRKLDWGEKVEYWTSPPAESTGKEWHRVLVREKFSWKVVWEYGEER